MIQFPDSAEEFYRLRDDRTNRCSGNRSYQNVRCALSLSEDAATTLPGQAMFITAANLLSRWCRDVVLIAPSIGVHSSLAFGATDLRGFVLSQMRDADPFGSFAAAQGPIAVPIALVIGKPYLHVVATNSVHISANGWLAGMSHRNRIDQPCTDTSNCLGAVAASCLGVAQTFKLAIRVPEERYFREGIFDLFSLSWSNGNPALQSDVWPQQTEIGRVLMVGAGSVASSAAYCMRLTGLAGDIAILDKDIVKVENFNRSPIFGRHCFGSNKCEAIADFLKGSSLVADPHVLWWDEFMRPRNRMDFDYDLWLPLANDFGVRFSIQNNLPPLMIHASTSANWGVNHGRHIPGRGDCLADRFPDTKAADFACATAELTTTEGAVDAALPFSSLFAGLLITADIVRSQLPDYPQVPNFAFLDWYGTFETIQKWDRSARPGCICGQQILAMHESFNGKTRHWKLSQ